MLSAAVQGVDQSKRKCAASEHITGESGENEQTQWGQWNQNKELKDTKTLWETFWIHQFEQQLSH